MGLERCRPNLVRENWQLARLGILPSNAAERAKEAGKACCTTSAFFLVKVKLVWLPPSEPLPLLRVNAIAWQASEAKTCNRPLLLDVRLAATPKKVSIQTCSAGSRPQSVQALLSFANLGTPCQAFSRTNSGPAKAHCSSSSRAVSSAEVFSSTAFKSWTSGAGSRGRGRTKWSQQNGLLAAQSCEAWATVSSPLSKQLPREEHSKLFMSSSLSQVDA